ncbi:hypothetical protein DFJ74DRAFT_662576 [Hyaloraphidium curvatum]|nr:hypothetical protein DFJ74DRAFT_662576 [Hyaloraphidium curvatum]
MLGTEPSPLRSPARAPKMPLCASPSPTAAGRLSVPPSPFGVSSSPNASDQENASPPPVAGFRYAYKSPGPVLPLVNATGRRVLGEIAVAKMPEYRTEDNRPRSVFLVEDDDDGFAVPTGFALKNPHRSPFRSPPHEATSSPRKGSPMDLFKMLGSKLPRRSSRADAEQPVGSPSRPAQEPSMVMKSPRRSVGFSPLMRKIVGGLHLGGRSPDEQGQNAWPGAPPAEFAVPIPPSAGMRTDLHANDDRERKRKRLSE